MDVRFYFTILTIGTFLENDILVKATCDTIGPSTAKCREQLNVTNGRACFYGDSHTMASISCSPSYTFNAHTTFTCTHNGPHKTWTPSAAAKCSMKASTPSTTLTSKLLPSESTLFSSVISSGTSSLTTITMMTSTGLRTSASPPTNSLRQSAISSTIMTTTSIFGTPSLTTITMMTSTGLRTSASPHTTSLRQSAISSTIMTTTSIMVTPDPSASLKMKDADINAAYIVVPVVVCVIALLFGVGILWWRRRTRKPSALFKMREPGSLISNQVYEANGIDRNCSLINVRQSRVHEYAEIRLDIMNSDGTVEDTYQTIDILPDNKADVKKSYDTFKLSETEFIDTNYSHIGLNNTQNNTHTDNTYSHTQLENGPQKPEITISSDDTYNKVNTTTLFNRRGQSIENSETEYNHAQAGGQDPENEADNYSHLNTNIQTPGKSTTNIPHQQNEDNIKNRNIRQLSAKDLQSNTGYEFAKDFDNLKRSSEIKMPKQDDARKNKNSNNYAQDLTSNTGYEFAKDFDYLQNRSEAPEYAKVTKKKPAVSKADNAGKGYETAVGTKHNYLTLEPEQNPAPTAALFNVVEDMSTETDEIPEAEAGHEYFTLEKQDM